MSTCFVLAWRLTIETHVCIRSHNMYAVQIESVNSLLLARDFNNPGRTHVHSLINVCGQDVDISTFHRAARLTDISTGSDAILRSISPWDIVHVPNRRVPSGYKTTQGSYDDVNIIGDSIFQLVAKNNSTYTLFLWDVMNEGTRIIPFCSQRFSGSSLCTAEWRSHTWVLKYTDWDEQLPDSRELCTIVDLAVAPADDGVSIAAGEGRLYGHVIRGIGQQLISAIDPRESNNAREVYSDGEEWSRYNFRDVPNGVAVVPLKHSLDHVNIFDERSCAMIGTSMLLESDEYLFCTRAAAYN